MSVHVLNVTNVNQALAESLHYLNAAGVAEESRNGPVIVAPGPVITVYSRPTERVLFSPLRDANPWFHLLGDTLWCMAGRNDVVWPSFFNARFSQYSDDGTTIRGSAYGYRWRSWLGYDQLPVIANELIKNPASRRCVLQMWSARDYAACECGGMPADRGDLLEAIEGGSRDVPCNCLVFVDARGGRLNITVCNRSNDNWFGTFGANVWHFSVLAEYLAYWVDIPVGEYRQMSNNFHMYTDIVPQERWQALAADCEAHDYYLNPPPGAPAPLVPMPILQVPETIEDFDHDLNLFMANPSQPPVYRTQFFNNVACPMYLAWLERREKRGTGLEYVAKIKAEDLQLNCRQWIERREAAKQISKEQGK